MSVRTLKRRFKLVASTGIGLAPNLESLVDLQGFLGKKDLFIRYFRVCQYLVQRHH